MTPTALDSGLIRFSTDALPERDRAALCREVYARELIGVDMAPPAGRPFRAQATIRRLSGVGTINCTMSTCEFERSRALAAESGDNIILLINRQGLVSASQLGREAELRPGEAMALATADPSASRQTDIRGGAVTVPRADLMPLMRSVDDMVMRCVPRHSEALRLLIGYVDMLHEDRLPVDDGGLSGSIAKHLLELLALALGANRDAAASAAAGGVRAARLCAIKADADKRIEDPALSVTAVAARNGISPRYVQVLFEDEGTTFSAFVLSRRLARAHGMLASPRNMRRRIADIAFDVGFGDLSHFNRAFRRHYGISPSDVRALALTRASDEVERA